MYRLSESENKELTKYVNERLKTFIVNAYEAYPMGIFGESTK